MNGALNTGLTFWQMILTLLVAAASFIVIRISLKFDLNRFIENRQTLKGQKLKNACTHIDLIPTADGRVEARSFFVSPPGTIQWQCQRCGLIKYQGNDDHERMVKYFIKNPEEYNRRNKKFQKLLKKSGQV